MSQHPIIIFDGICNFCNSSVNFIMTRDPNGTFKFTANQEVPGQKILKEHNWGQKEVGTLLLLEEGKLYQKSTAALRIARYLPFPWKLAYGFILIPAFLRNAVYDLIARNRYRWFGKREACRLPSEEERARFLA